jgi:transposase
VIDTGRPVAPVSRELGLGEQLLGRGVAQERARLAAPEEFAAAETEK